MTAFAFFFAISQSQNAVAQLSSPQEKPLSFYTMTKAFESGNHTEDLNRFLGLRTISNNRWTDSFIRTVNRFQENLYVSLTEIFLIAGKLSALDFDRFVNAVRTLHAGNRDEVASYAVKALSLVEPTHYDAYIAAVTAMDLRVMSNEHVRARLYTFARLQQDSWNDMAALITGLSENAQLRVFDIIFNQLHCDVRDQVVRRAAQQITLNDRLPPGDLRYFQRMIQLLETPHDQPIPDLQLLGRNEDIRIVGQEAISQEETALTEAYRKMATDPVIGPLFERYLPTAQDVEVDFNQAARHIEHLLHANQRMSGPRASPRETFTIDNALRTLQLLQGDASIERHAISPLASYQTYALPGLPNIRQLFVLAYRLMEQTQQETFIENFLAERFARSSDWQHWASALAVQMPGFERVLLQSDVALALQQDQAQGSRFIKEFQKILNAEDGMNTALATRTIPFVKSYFAKLREDFNPLIEALLMLMRGHNVRLFDALEPNRPACAAGAYLGLMKAIAELDVVATSSARSILAGVEIRDCEPV